MIETGLNVRIVKFRGLRLAGQEMPVEFDENVSYTADNIKVDVRNVGYVTRRWME